MEFKNWESIKKKNKYGVPAEEIKGKPKEKDVVLHLTPSRSLNRKRLRSYLRRIKENE